MAHSPLEQFKIKNILDLSLYNIDISITNSTIFMFISTLFAILIVSLPIRRAKIIPGALQNITEMIYEFVNKTLRDIAGDQSIQYFPLIFSSFIIILFANITGMLPYSFTTTSHIAVTFTFAVIIFVIVNIIAFKKHGFKFFSHFLPTGTPIWLAPLMISIELFTYLARPISLSIRLAANMVAGHILLKVLAGFIIMMGFWGFVPTIFVVIFTCFEFFVAILQAYIFTILICVYLNDAVNLH